MACVMGTETSILQTTNLQMIRLLSLRALGMGMPTHETASEPYKYLWFISHAPTRAVPY